VAPSILAGLDVPNEAVLDVPVGLAVPVEAALRRPLDIRVCYAGLGALGRLLVAALGVPVWLGVTVAARSRRRLAGFPARRTTSRWRGFILRCSAISPTRCSAFRSSALLAMSAEAALSLLPGTALDSPVWRCARRSGRSGARPAPQRCAQPHGLWALRSPCPSRWHSAGSSSWRSAFQSGAALSVPVEAALDDPVRHCPGRGGAWQVPRCGARRPGGNRSIN
jgi:hypothetical protein